MENTTQTEERSYIAFISYRHLPLDKEAAERIQKKIENFSVPKEYREKFAGKKLGHVFRDEDELPASSSLTDSIYYALDHSEFLIVICTPDLPQSKWCEAEIKYFLQTHDRDHVLAVLADGTPEESFSPYLLHDFDENGDPAGDIEPLAANISGENHTINKKTFNKETTRICAALIGCPFDALWQRERRARTNRLLTAAGAAVAVMAIFLGVVLNRNAQIAAQSAQIRQQNDQITAQNDELITKNQEIENQNSKIEEQNRSLQAELSSALVDSGRTKLENFNTKGALSDALAALESNDPEIYDHRAEKLLADALGAYQYGEVRNEQVYEQSTVITKMALSANEKWLFLSDEVGTIRCLDTTDFSVKWEYATGYSSLYLHTNNLSDRLLVKRRQSLLCLSALDGSVLWEYKQIRENWFQCLSDDGSVFAILDLAEEDGSYFAPVFVIFLDTATGQELGRCDLSYVSLGDWQYQIRFLSSIELPQDFGSDFSPDNSKFVLSFLADAIDENAEYAQIVPYFLIDLETFERTYVGAKHGKKIGYGYMDIHLGMDINNDGSLLFAAQNSPGDSTLETLTAKKAGDKYDCDLQFNELRYGVSTGLVSPYEPNVINQIYRTPPMLTSDERTFVFGDRTVYIFNKTENKLLRSYNMNRPILYANWLDEEAQEVLFILEHGVLVWYDFSTEKLEQWGQLDLELGDISFLLSLNKGIWSDLKKGVYLTVPKEPGNKLILSYMYNDPHAEGVFCDEDYSNIDIPNDSDLAFLITDTKDVSPEAVLFDRRTDQELKRTVVEDYINVSYSLLDEDHFIGNGRVYSFDGSFESLEGCVGSADIRSLSDGKSLSVKKNYDASLNNLLTEKNPAYDFYYPLLWLNEDPVLSKIDALSNGLLYAVTGSDSPPSIWAGPNGLAVCYGKDSKIVNGELQETSQPRFSVYDVYNRTLTRIENAHPDAGRFGVAVGIKEPVFAVSYLDGPVCIYDVVSGSATTLDIQYAPTEVWSLNFSEDDAYFLALTVAGRLDIIDRKTGELKFSETIPILKETIDSEIEATSSTLRNLVSNTTNYNIFSSTLADQNKLLLNYSSGKFIFIDMDSWTVSEVADNCYVLDSRFEKVYGLTQFYEYQFDQRMIRFPLYSLEDLKKWAEEELKR